MLVFHEEGGKIELRKNALYNIIHGENLDTIIAQNPPFTPGQQPLAQYTPIFSD